MTEEALKSVKQEKSINRKTVPEFEGLGSNSRGLNYMSWLEELDLSDNRITEIENLNTLTNL